MGKWCYCLVLFGIFLTCMQILNLIEVKQTKSTVVTLMFSPHTYSKLKQILLTVCKLMETIIPK